MTYLHPPTLTTDDHAAVADALASGWVSTVGPHLEALEQWAHDYTGMHAVAVSSGTAAVDLAMHLLGVDENTTVFAPSATFAASVFPAWHRGAKLTFIDRSPAHWGMDSNLLRQALLQSRATRNVVVAVDLYGVPEDYASLADLARTTPFELVADTAESVGAQWHNRPSGSGARFMIWSFNGNKIATCSGGGLLLCRDADDAAYAGKLSTQAREAKPYYWHKETGYNYRLSNVLAALALSQLKRLPTILDQHRESHERWQQALAHLPWQWQPKPEGSSPNHWLATGHWQFACTLRDTLKLVEALQAAKIEARPLWSPLPLMPVFEGTNRMQSYNQGRDQQLFARGLALPNGPHVTEAVYEQAATIMSNWAKGFEK